MIKVKLSTPLQEEVATDPKLEDRILGKVETLKTNGRLKAAVKIYDTAHGPVFRAAFSFKGRGVRLFYIPLKEEAGVTLLIGLVDKNNLNYERGKVGIERIIEEYLEGK